MTIKHALKDAHPRKRTSNLQRLVVAETIHDHDVPRPAKLFERAADIRRFVIREYQRRDLIEHYDRKSTSL